MNEWRLLVDPDSPLNTALYKGAGAVPIIFRHYKGGVYEALCQCTHSETKEQMVVYQSQQDLKIFVTPAERFNEVVTVDGVEVERFKLIEKPNPLKDATN